MGLVVLFGGFSGNDVFESAPSAWAIQHGQITCAFPKGFKVTAPLYPLLSGGLARLAGLGHTMPFPPRSAMGPDCDRAFVVINAWSSQARVVGTTLKFAYGGWIVLMAGAIAALRAAGRGLRGWEPATLILLACLPTVWTCVESTFHPEDLMAVGFALAAVACALRGSWIGAGALIGLAVLSQQFAILVAVPLLIVAPARERVGYGATAAFTFALVALPLVLASSSSAAHSIFLGTGDTGGIGGSLLWELGLQGTPLLALSRIVPVLLSVPLAWWAVRRLGRRRSLQPVALLSLVAVALCLRLIFEQQIFEYYYMGLSVVLVLLDVARGHIRGSLVAWLIAVPTVFIEEISGAGISRAPGPGGRHHHLGPGHRNSSSSGGSPGRLPPGSVSSWPRC